MTIGTTQDLCNNWFMRSSKTPSYDLIESAKDDWEMWVGSIQAGSSLLVLCNECATRSDCNDHGQCDNDKKCLCDETDDGTPLYFGEQCQLEMPCEVLVSK